MNTRTILIILIILYLLYRNKKTENFTCIDNATDAKLGSCTDINDSNDLIGVSGTTLQSEKIGLTNTTSNKLGMIDIENEVMTIQGSSLNGMINSDNTVSVDKIILPEDASVCFPNGKCIDKNFNKVTTNIFSGNYPITGGNIINESLLHLSTTIEDAGRLYVQYVKNNGYTGIITLRPGIISLGSYVKLPRRIDLKPGYKLSAYISPYGEINPDGNVNIDIDDSELYCEIKNTTNKTLVIYETNFTAHKYINDSSSITYSTYAGTTSWPDTTLSLDSTYMDAPENNMADVTDTSNIIDSSATADYTQTQHNYMNDSFLYRPANYNIDSNICYGDSAKSVELNNCSLNGGIMYDNYPTLDDSEKYEYTIKKLIVDTDNYEVINLSDDNNLSYITSTLNDTDTTKLIYLNMDAIDSTNGIFSGVTIPNLLGDRPVLDIFRTMKINKI